MLLGLLRVPRQLSLIRRSVEFLWKFLRLKFLQIVFILELAILRTKFFHGNLFKKLFSEKKYKFSCLTEVKVFRKNFFSKDSLVNDFWVRISLNLKMIDYRQSLISDKIPMIKYQQTITNSPSMVGLMIKPCQYYPCHCERFSWLRINF